MQSTTLFVLIVLTLQGAVAMPQLADIVDTAIADGRFKILVTALTAADLVTTLKGPGPFTVFAPTDAAFAKLPPGTVTDLLKPENRPKLIKILTYHVIAGKAITAADIIAMHPPFKLEMLNGIDTIIHNKESHIKVNDASIIVADIMATNGIIHALDTVLLPPDIVLTAIEDGRFKVLVTALTAAGLVDTLKGTGPFTVFAPTDGAFAKLPPGTVADLLKPENKPKLIKILTYHVVGGRALTTADIIAMKPPFKLEMLNGLSTNITIDGDKIKVNDATVIVADDKASNGVIQALDTVLLP